MIKASTKEAELVEELLTGRLLEKTHNDSKDCIEYLFHENRQFFNTGWSSAIGTVNDRLLQLIKSSELWKVSEYEVIDRPWTITFK